MVCEKTLKKGLLYWNCQTRKWAKAIVAMKRLLVGWIFAKVKVETETTSMFLLPVESHIIANCTGNTDLSDCCYNCRQAGHKINGCSASPYCLACCSMAPPGHKIDLKACKRKQKKEEESRKSNKEQQRSSEENRLEYGWKKKGSSCCFCVGEVLLIQLGRRLDISWFVRTGVLQTNLNHIFQNQNLLHQLCKKSLAQWRVKLVVAAESYVILDNSGWY